MLCGWVPEEALQCIASLQAVECSFGEELDLIDQILHKHVAKGSSDGLLDGCLDRWNWVPAHQLGRASWTSPPRPAG